VPEKVGVISTFQTPYRSRYTDVNFEEQAQRAAAGALSTAGMRPDDIDAIVFSLAPTTFMGVADADRWAIDGIFGAGKPMMRVHTGGTTGGSAVHAAYALVRSGMFSTVMIVGAERISETPDAQEVLNMIFDPFYERDMPLSTNTNVALLATRWMRRHGVTHEELARVTVRQRRNATKHPVAHLKGEITVQDVMDSPMISYPFKLFDICPRSSGSAAMIIGGGEALAAHQSRPAFINGIGSMSDTYWVGDRVVPSSETEYFAIELSSIAARECYARAGITDPFKQIQVAEIYDPYTAMNPIQLESLGFCAPGKAVRYEDDGLWDIDGGGVAVCPSGGTLCSNPIAISGLARCIDAADQVMGTAGEIQVKDVRNAICTSNGGIFQFHNITIFGDDHVER
jgi:acetyl-CoA C-acetyltransferase